LLDGADQVAEEADRVLEDLADHAGGARSHLGQHLAQLLDGVDQAPDGVPGLVEEALFSSRMASQRSSTSLAAATYFWARSSTSDSDFSVTAWSSSSNLPETVVAASRATWRSWAGCLAT